MKWLANLVTDGELNFLERKLHAKQESYKLLESANTSLEKRLAYMEKSNKDTSNELDSIKEQLRGQMVANESLRSISDDRQTVLNELEKQYDDARVKKDAELKEANATIVQLTADLEEARTNAYDQPRDNRGRFRSPEDETASAQEREDGTETQVTTYG